MDLKLAGKIALVTGSSRGSPRDRPGVVDAQEFALAAAQMAAK
jgi:hypothetical protein